MPEGWPPRLPHHAQPPRAPRLASRRDRRARPRRPAPRVSLRFRAKGRHGQQWSPHGDDFEGAGVRHRRCGRATHLRRSAGAHHDPPVRRGRRRRALHLLRVPGDEQPLRLDDCRRAGARAQARAREPGGAHLLLRRGFGLQRGRDHLPVRGVEVRLVPRADAR